MKTKGPDLAERAALKSDAAKLLDQRPKQKTPAEIQDRDGGFLRCGVTLMKEDPGACVEVLTLSIPNPRRRFSLAANFRRSAYTRKKKPRRVGQAGLSRLLLAG